jgi:hypothetical protein
VFAEYRQELQELRVPETYHKHFSSVFRAELQAIEARRRRYRIEQAFGFLPSLPAKLPAPSAALLPAARRDETTPPGQEHVPEPSLKDLETLRKEADDARGALARARREVTVESPGPAAESPTPEPPATAANTFLQVARAWYDQAVRHRDTRYWAAEAAPAADRQSASTEWQYAEAILRAAARTLAEATAEVRREPGDTRSHASAPEHTNRQPLESAFAQLIAWEHQAHNQLAALIHAEEAVRAEAARATEAATRLQEAHKRLATLIEAEEELRRAGQAAEAATRRQQALIEAEEVRRLEAAAAEAATRKQEARKKSLMANEELAMAQCAVARAEHELFAAGAANLSEADRRAKCDAATQAGEEELQRRIRAWHEACAERQSGAAAADHAKGPPDDRLAGTRRQALDLDLVGMALSGGGIRSATFGLGVLQGLAQLRLLGSIDLLSTVSGGGYIGSWFAAWIRREGSLINVEKQLSPNRISQSQASRRDPISGKLLDDRPRDEEPEPVHHLRAYSRYLSPRSGLFSPDTWTLVTIYLRNVFVNALLFVPLAVAAVFLWRLLLNGYNTPLEDSRSAMPSAILTGLVCLAMIVGVGCLAWAEENLFEADRERILRDGYAEKRRFTHLFVLLPLLIIALIGSWIFSLDPDTSANTPYWDVTKLRYFGQEPLQAYLLQYLPTSAQFFVGFGVLSLGPAVVVRLWRWIRRANITGNWKSFNWRGLFANFFLAAFFGGALFAVLSLVIWPLSYYAAAGYPGPGTGPRADLLCLLHAVGMPLVFAAMVVGGFAEMAILGLWLNEFEREWRSRLAAYLLLGAAAWLVTATAVLLVPWLLELILPAAREWSSTNWTIRGVLTGAWAAISGGGAWLAQRSTEARQDNRPSLWSRLLMTVAPPVFLIGLAAGVSMLGQDLARWLAGTDWFADWAGDAVPGAFSGNDFLAGVASWPGASLLLVGASIAAVLVLGRLISVNHFSMHMLYANRLTRCYLGASVRKRRGGSRGFPTGVHEPTGRSPDRTLWPRQANRFTGFDPLDDLPLAELRTIGGTAPYTGPVPLINCALNCLAGDELAYQDRRADAFLATPEMCGGLLTGYAPTPAQLPHAANLSLGRVMTISGAAVDPNMSGLSPPLTALMTLLNTRLGWWLENPNPHRRPWLRWQKQPWSAAEPGLALRLLWEFFGWTNEDSPYVHLSDGGHFENLGVYELIRRRCRFIIVTDAGTDRVAASDNMATMLRLIRTDFGVRIELDASRMQLGDKSRLSAWHCCVGRIRYDEVDEEAVPGLMIYLQATLTGDEPPDLLQYVSRHPSFPRQSTLNQFFDEAQFEAYRALGQHVVGQVFGEAAAAWTGSAGSSVEHQEQVRAVFARLREQWLPPVPCISSEWMAAANAALQLGQTFDGKNQLTDMMYGIYPEVWPIIPATRGPLPEFHAVSQTLQVMEIVWAAMHLDSYHAHPTNRGWMNTFRRWTASAEFHRYWPFLRAEYSRPFVRFCEDILNLEPAQPKVEPYDAGQLGPQTTAGVATMNDQFSYEWSDQADVLGLPAVGFPRRGFIDDVLRNAVTNPLNPQRPLAWLIKQDSASPCGVACVTRTRRLGLIQPRPIPGEAEFFFWLRGAYRSMGIGREAAAEVLRLVDEACAFPPTDGKPAVSRLVAYYPLRDATAGCRMEVERWMDFYFDLGFRRARQPDCGLGAHFAILKR